MSSLEDHHVKQKPQDNVETNKYYYYAKQCLKCLFKYSFGSLIRSKKFPDVGAHKCTCTCFQSNKPTNTDTESEMVDSKPNREVNSYSIQDSKEADMKEAVNHHYQSHLKKWDQYQKFPWKVALHLLLVLLVTIQVS